MIVFRRKRNVVGCNDGSRFSKWKRLGAVLLCVVAGGMNALFGGGGGMLAVPSLRGLGVEGEKKIHATSVAVMVPLSIFSATVYTYRGIYDPSLALFVGCGAVVGGAIGALALRRARNDVLSLLFGALMIFAGSRYLR